MSAICDAFTCTPDVAERQDAALVRAILDARGVRSLLDVLRDPAAKAEHKARALTDNPGLVDLLVEMHRAQTGDPGWTAAAAIAAVRRDEPDEGGE